MFIASDPLVLAFSRARFRKCSLRAYRRLASIPVLIVTAFEEHPEGPTPDGVVLHKPVDRVKLLQTLEQLTVKPGF